MTQEDVAVKAGVALRTVQGFEVAERWPQPVKLAAIARALGFTAMDLRDIADGVPERAAS